MESYDRKLEGCGQVGSKNQKSLPISFACSPEYDPKGITNNKFISISSTPRIFSLLIFHVYFLIEIRHPNSIQADNIDICYDPFTILLCFSIAVGNLLFTLANQQVLKAQIAMGLKEISSSASLNTPFQIHH